MRSNHFEADAYSITAFVSDADKNLSYLDALKEIVWCLSQHRIWINLGLNSLRATFLRSRLGLLWVPLSLGIVVGVYGTLFSGVFTINPGRYLPYLASGWVGWRLIAGLFQQSSTIYQKNRVFLGNLNIPIPMYVYAKVFEIFSEFMLHSIVLLITMAVFRSSINLYILLIPVVMLMYAICGCGLAFTLGFLTVKFPDLEKLLQPFTQTMFFITPIIWEASAVSGSREILIKFNPFYHAVEVFRNCFNITDFNSTSWIVMGCITIALSLLGVIGYTRNSRKVRIWII